MSEGRGMREISPAVNATVEEYLEIVPTKVRNLIETVRQEKAAGQRIRPSSVLTDRSQILDADTRAALLDEVARLVDESLTGRADMCMQFADLLSRALSHMGLPARAALGKALYFSGNQKLFEWDHAWVRVEDEVVDGNVDILDENPVAPDSMNVAPYWGPIRETPSDRKLREDRTIALEPDQDVLETWWPELRKWIEDRQMENCP